MNRLMLRADELKPRDRIVILDESTNEHVVATVEKIVHGVVWLTDGDIVKVYDPDYKVEVRRLTVVK